MVKTIVDEKWVELNISNYTNSVGTIKFELKDGGGNGINSQIEIDSIFFVLQDEILVDVSVLLEGPYLNSSMQTSLLNQEELPLSQPYNISPWSYSGDESVLVIPSDVVDWILLELRDKNDSNIVLGRRAGFLMNSGKIVDLDGASKLSFTLPEDDYYISVIHRNHLPILSANPITITLE